MSQPQTSLIDLNLLPGSARPYLRVCSLEDEPHGQCVHSWTQNVLWGLWGRMDSPDLPAGVSAHRV